MDKQGSHTNQTPDNRQPSEAEGMSTHGEIHKETMTGGSASVSLDSGLTSALSRAPSPFDTRQEPVVRPQSTQTKPAQPQETAYSPGPAPQSAAPDYPQSQYPEDQFAEAQNSSAPYQETQYDASQYQGEPTERQEPFFAQERGPQPQSTFSQDAYQEEAHQPPMEDIYAQEHTYDEQADQTHAAPEAAPYPAQYQNYQDGMNDVFDEASEKPHTRRTSFLLLSALALVAVVAGGVIYFYKSSTTQTAAKNDIPVVKAENEPTKITPEKPGGIEIPHQKKLIYDRITGENSESSEQIVSREEPVAPVTPAQARVEAQSPATGNPFDQQTPANTADAPVSAPSGAEPIAKAQLPPGVSLPANEQVANVEVQTTTPVAISPPPVASAPVSPSNSAAGGDYLIQIASFRSQEEAVRNYENLSRKYAGLLSSYGPMIQRADLGSRGIYYRLRIGPMDSKETAANLCANLLAQGQKDCLVRRK